MAWPPPALPINRTNADPQQNTHPADHNALALAVNDTVARIKAMPPIYPLRGNTTSNVNLPAGGTLGYIPPVDIPVSPYKRLAIVHYRGFCTALAATGQGDILLLRDSTMVSRARIYYGPGNPMGEYSFTVNPNVAVSFRCNVTSTVASTWTDEDTLSGMDIYLEAFPDPYP